MAIFLFVTFAVTQTVCGQKQVYHDIYHGGITGAGYSFGLGEGTANFDVHIAPNSSIRKAYLVASRIGALTPQIDITLNSINYTLNYLNEFTGVLNNGGNPGMPNFLVHVIDVTDDLDSSITNYQITIPFPPGYLTTPVCVNCKYGAAFLIIFYENPTLSKVCGTLVINDQDNSDSNFYSLNHLSPIDFSNDVGFSIFSDRVGPMASVAGQDIYVNGFYSGYIFGEDAINSTCTDGGVKGSFYYENNSLFGLDDDNPDSTLLGSDGLSNIQNTIVNVDSVSFSTVYKSVAALYTEFFNSFQLSYTTPCDTFAAGVNLDILMDFGDSTLLSAYGGYKYKWQPSTGLSCDTCAITWAKPDSSTLYTCRIYNNDSCSKVLPVKVNIYNNISIDPTGEDIKLHLYPNPAIEKIIVAHSSNQSLEFMITNIQGIEIKKGILESPETSIDVSTFSPGIYFLQVKGGNFRKALRFIKQ